MSRLEKPSNRSLNAKSDPVHDLEVDKYVEFQYIGWKLWSTQNTVFFFLLFLLFPIVILNFTAFWKTGHLLSSIIRILVTALLVLDLLAVLCISLGIILERKSTTRLEVKAGFVTVSCFWILITGLVRIPFLYGSIFSPFSNLDFLSVYFDYFIDPLFLFLWSISNIFLVLFLLFVSYIEGIKLDKDVLNSPLILFGLFSLGPVIIFTSERIFNFTKLFLGNGFSQLSYIVFFLFIAKFIITPLLGRRAGNLEMKRIIDLDISSKVDNIRPKITIKFHKTRFLKYMKKVQASLILLFLFSLLLPLSPVFIMNLYKTPQISINLDRNYADNESMNVMNHVEALPLQDLARIDSDNIMTNHTLTERLKFIEDAQMMDIFYLFRRSPSSISLTWRVSIKDLSSVLLDTNNLETIIETYSALDWWFIEEAYFVYWVDGDLRDDHESFNSSELYAKWLYVGYYYWYTNSGSIFGGSSTTVNQIVFLDSNLDPICLFFDEPHYGYL